MTNFDYLIQLNTIAGRTYNDLSQYPVVCSVNTDPMGEDVEYTILVLF
jgi:hypothetical protein